jgi:hypothetical protein
LAIITTRAIRILAFLLFGHDVILRDHEIHIGTCLTNFSILFGWISCKSPFCELCILVHKKCEHISKWLNSFPRIHRLDCDEICCNQA